MKYSSNALAQEKTGEFWVQGKLLGTGVHGDFHHADVSLFIGKNPWQSHGIPRARVTLKEMAKDTQLLYVTHNKISMEIAEILLGVTMAEPGASRLVAVDVDEALEMVV